MDLQQKMHHTLVRWWLKRQMTWLCPGGERAKDAGASLKGTRALGQRMKTKDMYRAELAGKLVPAELLELLAGGRKIGSLKTK